MASEKLKLGEEKIPLVSVVMCVYNDEAFVEESINSILNQTFKNFEFIIVDDGSTDNTASILDKWEKLDSRIKVYHKKNSGTTESANFGISKARGKYIARIDSDDISFQQRLEIEIKYLNENPSVALIGGGAELINEEGNIVGIRNIKTKNPSKALLHRNIFQHSDVMFSKETFDRAGGYREKFRNGQDYDLWLRISEIADIAKLEQILGKWRLNRGGYSFSRRKEQLNDDKTIKIFAKQRRKSGKDNYINYIPSAPIEHRVEINESSYNLWISGFLLESYRKKDSRTKIKETLENHFDYKALLVFSATYIPVPVLKTLNFIRNFIKNNFN